MTDPDRHPIFVVGTGRSGTTLVRMMLNAHPRIHLTHEASFYLLGGLSRKATPREWLDRYLATAAFAWLGLDPERVREDAGGRPSSVAAIVRAIMRLQAERHGKVRYGDKTPLHATKLPRIFEDYPGARIVNVVRDPRGGVASLMKMPWATSSVGLNLTLYEAGWKAVRHFRQRIHEVLLEDLIEQPEATMRPLLEFLGEEFSGDVLRHAETAPQDDLPPFPWFEGAKRPISRRPGPPAWQRLLPPCWIRIIERKLRHQMKEYGYKPADLSEEPSSLEILSARVRDVPEALRSVRRLLAFLRMGRRKRLPPLEEQLQALLYLNPGAWSHYPGFTLKSFGLSIDGALRDGVGFRD